MSNIAKSVDQMKTIARRLVPYTFPKVPFEEEQEVLALKYRGMTIDGYDVTVCYSEADYGEYTLKSLQIQSGHSPFLPFHLICKIGRIFLGSEGLSYIEFFRNNRKVYCWTVKSKNGNLLPPSKKTKAGFFEGFEFRILHPGSVDLF